jgi:hypothetical protein
MRPGWLRVIGIVAAAAISASAAAQTAGPPDSEAERKLARESANEAQARFDKADYKGAIEAIQEAKKHADPPSFTVLEAQSQEKLGNLLEAQRLYQSVVDRTLPPDPKPAWVEAQADANKGLEALKARIPKLQLSVTGAPVAGLTVTVDGAPFDSAQLGKDTPMNPGDHDLIVEARGYEKAVQKVTLSEGTTVPVAIVLKPVKPVVIEVPPPPSPPPAGTPPLKIAGIVMVGVGGAALIGGAVAGGLAMATRDEIYAACGLSDDQVQRCHENRAGPLKEARVMTTLSTAAFITGGVGAAAGGILLLVSRSKAPPVSVTMSPGFVTVQGAF